MCVVGDTNGIRELFLDKSSCLTQDTGHLGGGAQCACRWHLWEEQEMLPIKILLSYSNKGG